MKALFLEKVDCPSNIEKEGQAQAVNNGYRLIATKIASKDRRISSLQDTNNRGRKSGREKVLPPEPALQRTIYETTPQ